VVLPLPIWLKSDHTIAFGLVRRNTCSERDAYQRNLCGCMAGRPCFGRRSKTVFADWFEYNIGEDCMNADVKTILFCMFLASNFIYMVLYIDRRRYQRKHNVRAYDEEKLDRKELDKESAGENVDNEALEFDANEKQ
jgi:hypothetical protein